MVWICRLLFDNSSEILFEGTPRVWSRRREFLVRNVRHSRLNVIMLDGELTYLFRYCVVGLAILAVSAAAFFLLILVTESATEALRAVLLRVDRLAAQTGWVCDRRGSRGAR
jgi:hypothetical protein